MAKRKHREEAPATVQDTVSKESDESGSEDESLDLVDAEFEFFDPQPDHDFHGIKALLRQLLDSDAQSFNISALTDLILAQRLVGSTVKVEGNESDPLAFLSVLNLHEHRQSPVITTLKTYLIQRAATSSELARIKSLLELDEGLQIGLVLAERLVNVPPELVPPMYKMLLEEIAWALEAEEPYGFSHLLILSKTYSEVESTLDENPGALRKQKKHKALGKKGKSATEFFFHPEDEALHRHASAYGNFEYSMQEQGASDSKRTFQELGIKPQGHMILIEAAKFNAAIDEVEKFVSQG